VSRPALGPTQPPVKQVPGAVSPRVKWSGREANRLPPSNAEDKNAEVVPPLPHTSSLRRTC
jgi:hypothetical protein